MRSVRPIPAPVVSDRSAAAAMAATGMSMVRRSRPSIPARATDERPAPATEEPVKRPVKGEGEGPRPGI